MIDSQQISTGPVARRLAGKIALVTGAGSGQGQQVALLFAKAGARVAASDINAEGLDRTCALAAAEHLDIEPSVVDASDALAVTAWVDAVAARHFAIDVLYNNGAAAQMAPFAQMTLQQWRETLKGELDVVFLPTRAAWRHMVARGGGSIINVASVSGMRGTEFLGAAAHAGGQGRRHWFHAAIGARGRAALDSRECALARSRAHSADAPISRLERDIPAHFQRLAVARAAGGSQRHRLCGALSRLR